MLVTQEIFVMASYSQSRFSSKDFETTSLSVLNIVNISIIVSYDFQ